MKTPQIVIGVVAALALAGGGFAAGMTFERSQNTAATTGATGATGARGGGTGGRGAFGGGTGAAAGGQQPVTGRILAVNDGSITVAAVERGLGGANAQASASPATTSEIVLVGASTRIVKTTEADVKLSDLKVNDQVTVVGTTDATGMVSATAIVVGSTNILGQLFGSQTGNAGLGGGGRPSPSPTKAP
jgi:trimeric autotransporter adhesin